MLPVVEQEDNVLCGEPWGELYTLLLFLNENMTYSFKNLCDILYMIVTIEVL